MREILFRGKRTDNGEWVYGSLQCFKGYSIFEAGWKNWISVSGDTVGQYTGLKDKNGVKIFEGDIVTFEDAVADYEGYHDDVFLNRGEVTYTERGMCLYFTNRQVVEMGDLFYKETADCEVIGNIYDNPALAGEEKKA
jgi:uncharacterized phage protein (TIGR01671 family)